ncbi:ATP-grasp domain-containing protein [Umezawaea sp. Da 62-37]|uniref:preATP grasp domain-containing protein n=1 Tax=Umezawaea sp. Da 62-37 TaxID=3075927 RepID=UPI0028F721A4|nr:ATP-grasp domain-containing protein [Umezawaea sp. Da 62-37]WNV84479.1 ATP-grasp domain-containing protein [Umezawaea sp. Da 62-37]
MDDFNTRLKRAVVGEPDTSLVFLGNFEVEEQWARGEHTLPRVSAAGGSAVVNHMDEFALLLAGEDDHVVLKTAPDADYLDYLVGLGIALPTLHVVAGQDPLRNVTEDALADPELIARLAGLDAHLTAHGVSEVEERLAAATGLPLATPDAATCKAVNSKVYSRRAADELGLRQPTGWACDTVEQLEAAFAAAAGLVERGEKVVVKEALGVSGKGIAVLESPRRMDRLFRMIAKQVEKSGQPRIAFCVENWVAKKTDLNYQFTVGRDGVTNFDFVKELYTEGGVHKGHRMPARLSGKQVDELVHTASLLGKKLAADGYFGVVGVDAMVDPDDGLYPVVEINARNNMSTYQVPLQERFVDAGQIALARHYPLRLTGELGFATVRKALDGLVLEQRGGTGLLVNNFATVNAGSRVDGAFDGRLYGILVGTSDEQIAAVDAEITTRLAEEDRR